MELRLENLTKVFTNKTGQETRAVDNLDITIESGTLVALLGPSGCGKSTTLFMIAGLVKPTSGKIFFGEDDVTKLAPEKRGIGLVFQNYALYPHMTVFKNILFPLENMNVPRDEAFERVKEMANLVGIGELLDRKPSQLSGGQQQRVAIARALVKKPRVLLLDEPLSNLDARLRLQMREEIKRIQRETGITTIFVTHDQEEAMSISDKMVVLDFGKYQQYDAPQEMYNQPDNLFVAKFLG
ncbi:MAG: ABC transporter ATP-binding protein, partial [Candidatus Izemoplasmatales bacterium]|nr:ABC transporter ATP-binding protein [Candidatus Izemoplasmatales bacterium]